ncbi:LytTR family DNA-binding domain-containing protein [Pedobacter sp. PLR]|uniref:LytR/AlgR family response regulator transcription factor n=1 Tax=Pedobacter sp. PLR TaxID=2994465 RepID=UPI002247E91D|nr:LytTR family DNA-binding domain-containing protein [Pedobacter sp. PLR]MCX2453356.1 LytTR family DNA-binding domain-containing protein [Pedobacter sp. PLR]
MKINCVIIDDEPFAQELIEGYIQKIPYLNLVASCGNVFEAIEILQNNEIDLLFSDVQMPEINGIDFIRSLKTPPFVIFITAHPNFAIDGFELDAVDYLVKPASFDRFLKSVNKVLKVIKEKPSVKNPVSESLFVKEGHKLQRIRFDEIFYIEGMRDYVKIMIKDRMIVTHMTMKRIEDQLPKAQFIRLQKSYIVRISAIKSINGNMVEIYDFQEKLPIGKQYKDNLFSTFGLTDL